MVNKPIYLCEICGWQAPNIRTKTHGTNVNNACPGRILRINRFQWGLAAEDAIRRNSVRSDVEPLDVPGGSR